MYGIYSLPALFSLIFFVLISAIFSPLGLDRQIRQKLKQKKVAVAKAICSREDGKPVRKKELYFNNCGLSVLPANILELTFEISSGS
jgi:hypothetical protein